MAESTKKSSVKALVRCPFCGKLNRVDLARAQDRPACGECHRPLLLDRPLKVTDAEFDRVLAGSDATLLVDFYADWCGPCKIMAPVLDQVARDRMGDVLVLKLDTDRNPVATSRFGIRGIPTLIAFRDGVEIGRETGAVPKDRVDALLARAASSGRA